MFCVFHDETRTDFCRFLHQSSDKEMEVPMSKINFKRTAFTFLILAVLSPIALTFQNFRHLDTPMNIDKDETSLNDALIDALKNAAEEHRAKKVALNLEVDDSSEKTMKRHRKPATIGDNINSENNAALEAVAGQRVDDQ
jgi:Cft2 family RNA processing exonuclease